MSAASGVLVAPALQRHTAVLRAGAGVSSPSTLFYPPTIPLQQYLLKATINRGHGTRFVCVCVL
jgi:hypothetical protein